MENDFNHTKIEETTDLRGNGLYSTAEARSGDELVRINSPLIAIPEAGVLETVCYQCFTDSSHTSLKKCAGCSVASYCSKSCQRDSWTLIHKLECQVLRDISKKQKGQPLVTAVRATMQILLKNKNTIERNRADRSWQEDRLVGHVTRMKEKDHARYDGLLLQSLAAKEFSKVEADMDSVLNLFARIEMNGIRIHQGDNTCIGLCLEPTVSAANHSCTPNAYISFTGRRLSLRALNTIKEGEEILISYIDPSYPLSTRQAELSRYYFTCSCDKCALDWDNYTTCLKTLGPSTTTSKPSRHTTSLLTPAQIQNLLDYGTKFISSPSKTTILTLACTLAENPYDTALSSIQYLIPLITPTPLAIQPIPSLLHTLYLHHLSNNYHLLSLTTILSICIHIDPILYPQPQHPTRVIHTFIAAKLIQEILFQQQQPPSSNPRQNLLTQAGSSSKLLTLHSQISYFRSIHALLILLDRLVDQSHGAESVWAREIRVMLGEVRKWRPMDEGRGDREMGSGSERGEEVLRGLFENLGELAGCVGEAIKSGVGAAK